MLLNELYDHAIPGYQDDQADNSRPKWHELRKTKLTLKQLRQLRKMVDVREYERHLNLKKIQKQYKAKAEQSPGM